MQPTIDEQDFPKWAAKARPESGKNGESAQEVVEKLVHAVEPEDTARRTKEVRAQTKELSTYFRHSYHLLYGQALGMVGSPEVAEDVVQEAFTNTSERIRAGTKIANFNSWLRCCVQNISIKHLRRKPALPLQEELEIGGYVVPVELVHTKQRFEDVCRAIDRLAPAQKSALILAEIRGMAHRDIAEVMNRSEGSVRQLISRARNRVREYTGPNAFSLVLPLFVAASAEARSYVPLGARARIVRSHMLSKMTEVRAATWQSMRRLGRPAPASTVVAMSVVMVIALGGSATNDRPSTGNTEAGSPLASSFSAATKAESANAVSDDSTFPSSDKSTVSGAAVSPQAASSEAGGSPAAGSSDESSGTHSQGTHEQGSMDSPTSGSEENAGGEISEPVAIIASPQTGKAKGTLDSTGGGGNESTGTDGDGGGEGGSEAEPLKLMTSPTVTGGTHVGDMVSCSGDTWYPKPDKIQKTLRRNGWPIDGADALFYTLTDQDASATIDCYVRATKGNRIGHAVTDAIWVLGAPVLVGPPTITTMTGGMYVGDTVRCGGASWANGPGTILYGWLKDGDSIRPPSTYPYLHLSNYFADSDVTCVVTTSNEVGEGTGTSKAIHVIVPPSTVTTE